jgi:hypothetical protein
MTVPVDNANFTTSAGRDNGRLDKRPAAAAGEQTGVPAQGEQVSLSAPPLEPVAETRLHSLDAARAVLEQVKQQIATDPAAALAGHRGLNPNAAAMTLVTAA